MKIAMLLDQIVWPQVINPRTAARFAALGELARNETRENGRDNARRLLAGADFAVTSWGCPAFDSQLLDAAPDLKLVVHAAGSVKSIVTDELYDRGVRVVSAAQVLSTGVSETALGLTIAAAKNIFALNAETHSGGWSHAGVTEMYDITIGIVGFGLAGRHYAELLQSFDVEVIASDPMVSAESMAACGVKKVSQEEVFSRSHMVNAAVLASMRDGAILINTARGSLVDEAALAEALAAGKLKCACLDVTDPEPPAPDSPLRRLPNCILTPHLAGQAGNGLQRLGDHCFAQICHYIDGAPLQGEVTRDMLATMA